MAEEQPDFLKSNQVSFKVDAETKKNIHWLRNHYQQKVPTIGYTALFRSVINQLHDLLSSGKATVQFNTANLSTDDNYRKQVALLQSQLKKAQQQLNESKPAAGADATDKVNKLEERIAALIAENTDLLNKLQDVSRANTELKKSMADDKKPEGITLPAAVEAAFKRRQASGLSADVPQFITQLFNAAIRFAGTNARSQGLVE